MIKKRFQKRTNLKECNHYGGMILLNTVIKLYKQLINNKYKNKKFARAIAMWI